jgi:hypothetical protein
VPVDDDPDDPAALPPVLPGEPAVSEVGLASSLVFPVDPVETPDADDVV